MLGGLNFMMMTMQGVQSTVLYQEGSFEVGIPNQQLNTGSLCVSIPGRTFKDWTEDDHCQSYTLIQKIARQFGDKTFLAYASHELGGPFSWEIVPYQDSNFFSNTYEDIAVAYRVVNGGNIPDPDAIILQKEEYANAFEAPLVFEEKEAVVSNDPFCREDVINKQQVLEGNKVRVLYDQCAIGAGDHKIHFLFTPKAHRKDFRELTSEEYKEASNLMQFVIEKLQKDTSIYRVYQYHKTGRIQSVKHLHIHLVATVSEQHDADTKTQLMVNAIFFSSKLDDKTLESKVSHYKSLFNDKI